jgi:hypothetical protein
MPFVRIVAGRTRGRPVPELGLLWQGTPRQNPDRGESRIMALDFEGDSPLTERFRAETDQRPMSGHAKMRHPIDRRVLQYRLHPQQSFGSIRELTDQGVYQFSLPFHAHLLNLIPRTETCTMPTLIPCDERTQLGPTHTSIG